MRFPPRAARIGAAAAVLSALLVGGTVSATTAGAVPVPAATASAVPASAASVGSICHSALPPQADDTLGLIAKGGPYPYPQDGTVFSNREGVLPGRPSGYYHEYTVETPGSSTRGARRIVTGERNQEDYYTSDHYATFDLIDFGC
ncbi:ribonuclease [Streptomyces misionensis]|uniref:Ribonuclease n=1 Tax=Streptomyces misionensis TaxID=67331 RepID=A0A5C6JRW4_9ACTN|nr:ribonuclease domain-containing protein [Streptomyces misionensis]TWV44587.1 ribonuclease [Streptomyces misionensis]